MLAVVPEIEVLLVGRIDVHGGDEHPLAGQRHPNPPVLAARDRTP